jgi:hypothetical protein
MVNYNILADRVAPEKPDILNGLPHKLSGTIAGDSRMKQIQLTQGEIALVDDFDLEQLSQFKWYVHKAAHTCYARTDVGGRKNKKHIYMHRLLVSVPAGLQVDHRDYNGLNNQRCNLRICSQQENMQSRRSLNKTSKYKGVYKCNHASGWYARAQKKGEVFYLGYFRDETEAANAYDAKAKELFGEFAYLNFPKIEIRPLAHTSQKGRDVSNPKIEIRKISL